MNLTGRVLVAGALAVLSLSLCVPAARAVFPGSNGKIALVTEYYPGPCGDCDPQGQRGWIIGRAGRTASFPAEGVAFSPSGSRIAYDAYRSNAIWIARPDGSKLRLLTGSGSLPAWSPLGGNIAYSGPSGVVVTRASGGEKRVLPTGGYPSDLAWAPNGELLAFDTSDSVGVVGADGRNLQTVATKAPLDYNSFDGLAWSATGWVSYRFDDELWIARPGQVKERALLRGMTPAFRRVAVDYSWSADGRRVAFVRDGGLWVIGVPDGTARLVVPRAKAGYLPQWSPDGRLIAYIRGHRVLTVPAQGGQPKVFGRFDDPMSGQEYVAEIDWQPRPPS
jgi:dipeptidyl aminopeptidase/acylaminoacyl peptidase